MTTTAAMDLKWEVFVTPGIPIVTRDRPADVQELFFQATASTLIYGDKDAVLVDAYLTTKQTSACTSVARPGRGTNIVLVIAAYGL